MSSHSTEDPKTDSAGSLKRRFSLHGDAWTRILGWAVRNVPPPLEPFLLLFWSTVFFLVAGRQRRAIAQNMRTLFPRDSWLRAHGRAWRVFWNFANTEVEAVHCLELGAKFDWEVEGREHFDQLAAAEDGAIILTAHMSNYDVAGYLFAKRLRKPLHTVRAPEATPELQALKDAERHRLFQGHVKIHYNTQADDALGLELLRALQAGEVVAIQGDRLIGGAAMADADFGGLPVKLPNGPFALASIAKCRVFPLFIVRMGRRRYRIVCRPPLTITRERSAAAGRHQFQGAMDPWGGILAEVARKYWYQWYVFEPMFREGAKWPGDSAEPIVYYPPLSTAVMAPRRSRMLYWRFVSWWVTLRAKPGELPQFFEELEARSRERKRKRRETRFPVDPSIESYYSGDRDLNAYEAYLCSTCVPMAFGSVEAVTLYELSWNQVHWPIWTILPVLAFAPIWWPLSFQIYLLAIHLLLWPVRRIMRISTAQTHSLHWWVTIVLLTGWSLTVVHMVRDRFDETRLFGWDQLAVLASIPFLTYISAFEGIGLILYPLLRKKIRAYNDSLPLNKLPEQLGNARETG